jgi:aldose 1-epimerase
MSGIVETLAAAEMRLEVAPELGGRIISLSRGDQTLMRGREEDISLACFAMLPYCNRIASGQFTFQRSRVELTPNFPGEAHSIHGTGCLASWRALCSKKLIKLP